MLMLYRCILTNIGRVLPKVWKQGRYHSDSLISLLMWLHECTKLICKYLTQHHILISVENPDMLCNCHKYIMTYKLPQVFQSQKHRVLGQ